MSNDKKPGQLGPEEAELQTSSQVTANHIPDSTSVPPATQNLPETATGAWQSPDETGVHSNANAAEVEATRALPQSAGSQTRTSPAARTTTGAFVAVAGYEVEGELGRGGMGVVYKARQTSLNRVVALKMLLGAGEGTAVARFLAEAEAVAAIRHPHVVQVFDFGQSPDGPYMALEYLPGGTLADRLKGGQRLESRIAAEMFEKVARGLQAAHSQGIIHRDIKPGNVLFDESNEPKVADFGLAKRADSDLTRTGAVMGTPAYMAPEQADGHTREVGPTADVWAVGVMLYEALTGQRPFVAARTDELLVKVLMSDPDPLRSRTGSVPRDLDTICLKCLEKEPTRRYQSALALAQDLERFRAGEPILARPDGVIRKVWRRVRKRAVSVGLAVALLAAVAAAGWLVVQSGSDRQLTALTKEFEEGINAEEWPSGHRENLEALTDRLAASAPDQADSARKRLTERATKRFRDGLQRARVEITDVPALEAELAWIAARDAEVGVTLNRELRDRLRGWRPILDLTSPFDRVAESFSPELVAVEAGQLRRVRRERMPPNVPTRTSSRGPLKVEVDFAPGWEDGTGYGVVFHLPMAPGASPNSGYTFRVVPVIRKTASDAQGAAANPSGNIATFRNPDATVRAEILRDGVVLREYEARPRVGSLRLAAERAGAVLRFRVNDEPQFEFVDAFPLGGDDTTVLGVLWSPQAAITRLQIQTQSLPSSASPLERADDLFDRGQFVEAVAIYQRATTDPATAAEALCKAGMCYVNVKRTNEALPLLENAMTQKGDRWPAIAACQLWLLFLESGRYDEAETALASTSAKFTPEQLARHVSHATRNKILSLYTSTKVNYFAPDVDLVRRSEAAVRISRLLDEEAGEQHNKQYQLLLALAVTGDYVQAREVGRQYMPFAMDQTATHPAALDTFPWAMRWYCWMMRQTGKAGEARTDLVRWRDEYLPRSPAGSPAWFRWSYMPMHLEFARINAEEQKINAAEWEIDVYLKDSPRPIHNYSFHAPAYLMKGFCRLEQGDAAGAVKAWDQGRWQSYTAEWKDGKRPPQPTPPGRNALMDHWMLSSLCDKLTDAEAKDVLRDLMAMLVQDQTMTQMAGIIQLSPDVLRNAWRSPRGRELARKMAFLQFGPVEHYRNLIRVLIYEKFRQELCDGKPSPEQDEVLWDGVLRLGNLFFDRKLSKAQLFPAALGWKGTIGVLGWGGVAHQLPPDTRGPVAYVLGLRYLKLNKPADAKMLFRTAVTDSAASSAVNRLATEEIAKLDGKPGPTLLPVAPPPRERR